MLAVGGHLSALHWQPLTLQTDRRRSPAQSLTIRRLPTHKQQLTDYSFCVGRVALSGFHRRAQAACAFARSAQQHRWVRTAPRAAAYTQAGTWIFLATQKSAFCANTAYDFYLGAPKRVHCASAVRAALPERRPHSMRLQRALIVCSATCACLALRAAGVLSRGCCRRHFHIPVSLGGFHFPLPAPPLSPARQSGFHFQPRFLVSTTVHTAITCAR